VIGAGAGPWPVVGTNSEMAANVCLQEGDVTVKTKIIKVNTDTMGGEEIDVDTDQFALMANFYLSQGKRDGKVVTYTNTLSVEYIIQKVLSII